MKNFNKVTAFISAVLITSNCCHSNIFAQGATNKNDEPATQEEKLTQPQYRGEIKWENLGNLNSVTISNKQYDGTTNASIDFSNIGINKAEDYNIPGVVDGDDIKLTAQAFFASADAGLDKDVTVIFSFTGKDVSKYKIENEKYEISKKASIEKANVTIIPEQSSNFVFCGEPIPSTVDFTLTGKLANLINASSLIIYPDCRNSDKTGEYSYSVVNNGEELNNIDVKVKGYFHVYERPNITLKSINTDENGKIKDYTVAVEASNKSGAFAYYVGKAANERKSSFDLTLSEEDKIKFYVSPKNDNNAISYVEYEIKKPQYEVDDWNTVISTSDGAQLNYVSMKDDETNKNENILTTNKGVRINVVVTGNGIRQKNKVVLKNGEEEYYVSREEVKFDNKKGAFTYIYTFNVDDVKEDIEKIYNFVLDVTDEFGNNISKQLSFRNDDSQSSVSTIIVDRKKPDKGDIIVHYSNSFFSYIKNGRLQTSNGYFIADGIVTDSGSGIAKIEYKWDNDIERSEFLEYGKDLKQYRNYDAKGRMMIESKGCNDHYRDKKFGSYNKDSKTPFQILVPYSESISDNTRWDHYLTLRLTDNAGNVAEIAPNNYLDGNSYRDTKPPVVKSVDMTSDSGIRKLPSGNYSKDEIFFVVEAEDQSESDKCSGITEYDILSNNQSNSETIIDRNSDWKNKYEVIFENEASEEKSELMINKNNKLYTNVFVAVFDKSCSSKYYLNNISGLKSNDILIDNVVPKANADLSQGQTIDNFVWFNDGELIINADDKIKSGDASGIYSISLSEDKSKDNIVVDNSKAKERKIEDSYSIEMSKLTEGEHTYYYYTEDNAGNRSETKTVRFGYDKSSPSCKIKAVSPVYDECWYKEEEDFDINIDFSDALSGIDRKTVKIAVNGQRISIDKDDISENDNSLIYTLNKNKHLKNIPLNDDQCYHIEVSACDKAGNELESDENSCFDVHIDKYSPWINEVKVEKIGPNTEDKKINILNKGIFANTGVKLDVLAFDSNVEERENSAARYNKNESRIEAVYITFEGENELKKLKLEGDKYTYAIPLPEKEKSRKVRFKLTVRDNTGRECSTDYVISTSKNDVEGEKADQTFELKEEKYIDLIIEEIPPSVEFEYPKAHYEEIITSENEEKEEKRFWFNADILEKIIYTIWDEDSGLNNVVIKENGKILTTDDSNDKHSIISADVSEKSSIIDRAEHIYEFIIAADHGSEDISGLHKYEVIAEDNAGNRGVPVEYEYYIDNIKPKIIGAGFPVVSDAGNSEMEISAENFVQAPDENINYSIFYKDEFTAKIYVDDESATSGLKEIKYSLISSVTDENNSSANIITEKIVTDENGRHYAPVKIYQGFKGRISVEAFDNVNNSSGTYILNPGIISENDKPEIDITVGDSERRTSDDEKLFTEDASVRVVIKDKQSGLQSWTVNIDSEASGGNQQSLITQVTNEEHKVGDVIGDGWLIEEMDANLITSVSKTFVFDSDDNHIEPVITANDNCGNTENKSGEKFTVDKTAPVIDIRVSEGINGTDYYNAGQKAEIYISVTERNFDPSLIKADIENTYGSNVPTVEFRDDPDNRSLHTAVLRFGEGDYIFDIKGKDLAGYDAVVNKPFDGRKRLYIDETAPVVSTNFDSFGKQGSELYYNSSKRASISVIEHNFDSELTGLKVYTKTPGSAHDQNGFNDEKYSFVSYSSWKQDPVNKDRYTLEFDIGRDSVYKLEIDTYDKAGNKAVYNNSRTDTEVFEIDTTAPRVISKNGIRVEGEKNEIEFLDVYTPERADAEVPTIEFDDTNFESIKYTVNKYIPRYNNKKELGEIKSEKYSGVVKDKKFVLNDFVDDGIYYVEIYAVDKAGNKSILNKNTYARMMKRDILAYIPESSIEKKSGLFSLEYENGDPISKRPDDFSDIKITVMSASSSEKKIVLRDMNGEEIDTKLKPDSVNSDMFGVKIYNYTLKADFFKENYKNDIDKELILTVKDDGERIDLGKIHIDNIKPEAKLPSEFKSWKWYPGKKERTIVLSNISEILDTNLCKIYDNNDEIPFVYSEEDKTLRFTIDEGWHNIGIHLVDTAGNVCDIQETENICVGNFWTWVIGGCAAAAAALAGFIIFRRKKRKKNKLL